MSKLKIIFIAFLLLALTEGCNDVKFQGKKTATKTQTCTTPPCTSGGHTYSWYQGGYGICSKACGGGTQTQNVECRREDNVAVADSFCTGTKPNAVQSCNVSVCPNTYNWNIGAYGTMCSKTCGGGEVTRTVICQDQTGATVADALCPPPKPATSMACNTQVCVDPYTYNWYVIAGTCSKECGGGVQTDQVLCRRSPDNAIVADSFCNAATKPPTVKACNEQACPIPYTYNWTTGAYSVCSKQCGGGLQTRSIQCQRSPDMMYVAENFCNPATKPVSQQACNTQACPTTRNVTTTKTVTPANNQVDVIMIVDDSSSMGPDNTKLAQRMSGFLTDLDALNIDYQVCITTTDITYYAGSPIKWVFEAKTAPTPNVYPSPALPNQFVINKTTPNKNTLFTQTIKAIGAEWSSDERGIYALNLMVKDYKNTGCFRDQAALATILISDEDERSTGGDPSLSQLQYKPLEAMDMPNNLIAAVDAAWTTATFKKPFTWNSIVVKPGDSACEAQQDAQGTPAFQGKIYKDITNLTAGHLGSICDTDYSQNLKYIKDRTVNSLPGITLECAPIGTPTFAYSQPVTTNVTITGNQVQFSPALPEGVSVTVNYVCPN